jgi:hypothetical protein
MPNFIVSFDFDQKETQSFDNIESLQQYMCDNLCMAVYQNSNNEQVFFHFDFDMDTLPADLIQGSHIHLIKKIYRQK